MTTSHNHCPKCNAVMSLSQMDEEYCNSCGHFDADQTFIAPPLRPRKVAVTRCTFTWNPKVWPYVARCIKSEGHSGTHETLIEGAEYNGK